MRYSRISIDLACFILTIVLLVILFFVPFFRKGIITIDKLLLNESIEKISIGVGKEYSLIVSNLHFKEQNIKETTILYSEANTDLKRLRSLEVITIKIGNKDYKYQVIRNTIVEKEKIADFLCSKRQELIILVNIINMDFSYRIIECKSL